MRPWLRAGLQVVLAVGGLGTVALAIAPGTDVGRADRPFVVGVGLLVLLATVLWRAVSRDSGEPDLVDGQVPLGDGRTAVGQLVTMPRSKRVAIGVGGLLFAAAGAWMALDPAAAWPVRLLGAVGVAMGVVGGAVHLRRSVERLWLGFSPAGITLCAVGGHFTVPWDAVALVTMTTDHRSGARSLAIDCDLDRAVGSVARTVLVGSRFGSPTLLFPGSLFDLAVGDVIGVARRWAPPSVPVAVTPA